MTVIAVAVHYPDGDREFPLLIASCLAVSSAFLLVKSFLKEGAPLSFSLKNYRKIVLQVVLIIGFFFLLPRVGFFISAALLSLLTILNGGYPHKIIAVLFSVIFPGVIFFIFHILLEVPLPPSFAGLGIGL
ncbi:tripartite tricarboxylate transporter TctB family protein [Mailhella massiliensis]